MARYMALLERFPHGLEFQCCRPPANMQQEWAKERAEERQIKDFVDYYNDPTPRYQTHISHHQRVHRSTGRNAMVNLGFTEQEKAILDKPFASGHPHLFLNKEDGICLEVEAWIAANRPHVLEVPTIQASWTLDTARCSCSTRTARLVHQGAGK